MAIEQSPARELVSKFEQAKDLPSFDTAFDSAVLMSKSDSNSWKEAQSKLQQTDLSSMGLAGFKIDGLDTQPKDTSGYSLPPELNISNSKGVVEHIDQQGEVLDASNTLVSQLSFTDKTQPSALPASDNGLAVPSLSNPTVALDTPIATPGAPSSPAAEAPLKPADATQPSSTSADLLPPTTSPGDVVPSPTTDAAPTNPQVEAAVNAPPPGDVTVNPAAGSPESPPQAGGEGPPPPVSQTTDRPITSAPTDSLSPATDASDSTTNSGTPFGPNGRTMTMSADGTTGVYGIQSGDTLWSIAQDALTAPGQTLSTDQQAALAPEILALVDQIASDNNITNPDDIYPGQQLTIRKQTPDAANGTPTDGSTAQTAGGLNPLSLMNGQIPGLAPTDSSGGGGPTSDGGGSDDSGDDSSGDNSVSTGGYTGDQDDNNFNYGTD